MYILQITADQRVDQRLTESHLPKQYLDIALTPRAIYCSAKVFDPPTQSGT